ncbi:MAG: hypothetical protein IRY98_11635 [Alicyclobacillaceae bacterium]|nr:hypothetical protein [Alicyclobacillaceae bacterium]
MNPGTVAGISLISSESWRGGSRGTVAFGTTSGYGDGFYRRGKAVAMLSEAAQAVEGLESLRHVVAMSRVGVGPAADGGRGEELGRAHLLAADRLLREDPA